MNKDKGGPRLVGACLASVSLSVLPACAGTESFEKPASGLGHEWISDAPVDSTVINVKPLKAEFRKASGQALSLGTDAITMVGNCVLLLDQFEIPSAMTYDMVIRPNDAQSVEKGIHLEGATVPQVNKLISYPPQFCA